MILFTCRPKSDLSATANDYPLCSCRKSKSAFGRPSIHLYRIRGKCVPTNFCNVGMETSYSCTMTMFVTQLIVLQLVTSLTAKLQHKSAHLVWKKRNLFLSLLRSIAPLEERLCVVVQQKKTTEKQYSVFFFYQLLQRRCLPANEFFVPFKTFDFVFHWFLMCVCTMR